MKKVNVEKFLADYELSVQERETATTAKEEAIEKVKADNETMAVEKGWSEFVKNGVLELLLAEKEKEFDFVALDEKVSGFEKYLEDVEEETPVVEEVTETTEIKVDEFGNQII